MFLYKTKGEITLKFKKDCSKLGVVLSVLVLSLLVACSGNNSEAPSTGGDTEGSTTESINIRLAHVGSEEHQNQIASLKFKELIEERSDGAITVQIFPNGQLGGEGDAVEGVQNGTIDMTPVAADGNPATIIPELNVYGVPYLFRDREHVYKVLDGEIGQELLDLGTPHGLIGVGYWEIGFANFTNSKRAINEPEDMKGLKLRVQAAPIWTEFLERLDALPVPMSFTELYSAMEQGVVDGQENPIATINAMKFYEVSPYIALSQHTYKVNTVYMSEQTWNKFSEEQQVMVKDAVKDTYEYQRDYLEAKEQETIEELKSLDYVTITEPNLEAFAELAKGIEEVMSEIPPELVERIRAE